MSDYSETFTKVDGNTIEASDFETEFTAIETAIATKADLASAALTTPTINGVTGRGIVILDTPQEMLADGDKATGAWTTIDVSAEYAQAASDGATAAILMCYLGIASSSGGATDTLYLRKAGTALGTNLTTIAARTTAHAAGNADYDINTTVVALDASSDFDYYLIDNSSSNVVGIYMIGYYV